MAPPSTSSPMAPPSTGGDVRYQLETSQMNCPGASPWAIGSALLLQVKGRKQLIANAIRAASSSPLWLQLTEAEHTYK